MYFKKYPYPANFEFVRQFNAKGGCRTAGGRRQLSIRASADDIYHLSVTGGPGWDRNDSEAKPKLRRLASTHAGTDTQLKVNAKGGFELALKSGETLLASLPGRFFGECGEASLFEFLRRPSDRFYGMGEKWTGLEHSNKSTKFWNTDVFADFAIHSIRTFIQTPDPIYVSIPYVILKRGETYLGLLLDNPYATSICTNLSLDVANQMHIDEDDGCLYLMAERGQPNLYVLYGPTLPELTRKLQTLTGTTPLPPAWSLGYHQCRWGYQSEADLTGLDRKFRQHGIPADGLWLDIDYMRGYRVFTFDSGHFPNPAKALAKLAKAGRKVVPIIDPGVKLDTDYDVYKRGRKAGAYCLNQQGKEYVGLVWPGETVFPDYSTKAGRDWWAREVKAFAKQGLNGAWLDMNDPATGSSELYQMRFQKGKQPHDFYHNQYALGMARASREGFLAAHPNQRPFTLCRSGYTGSQRYTAIWTGDNVSNYTHLKGCISCTLNLALSGIPFNAPDTGGFHGDTTAPLLRDWYKACFLFPVLRNHSEHNTRQQEPWAFDQTTLDVTRTYIRLRYRLRPYLYQLFAEHEKSGEAILRPLFYDFASTKAAELDLVDDQFLVGPSLMQAPFVEEGQKQRRVVLPAGTKWFDLTAAKWLPGGRKITVKAKRQDTPIYVRDGSILPLARLKPTRHEFVAAKVDFHVFLSGKGEASTRYIFDDGESFAYRQGKRSEVEINATRDGTAMEITVTVKKDGFGSGDFTYTTPADVSKVTVNGKPAKPCGAQGVPFGNAKTQTWKAAK